MYAFYDRQQAAKKDVVDAAVKEVMDDAAAAKKAVDDAVVKMAAD
jgi:hypothetical protein